MRDHTESSSRFRAVLLAWIVPGGLLTIWQLAALSGVLPPRILPSPLQVLHAAVELTRSGELPRHLWRSLERALLGLGIGGSVGLVLGVTAGLAKTCEILFDSSLQMLRTIPHLALIPLTIVWFGIGEPAKIFLISLGTFFPLYLNTFHGIRSVDAKLIEAAEVYQLRGWPMVWQVLIPGALPSVLVGLRHALGVMWVTLIVAETLATQSGIGFMINEAREFMQTPIIVVGILLYALLGKLVDSGARVLERTLLPWRQSEGVAR